MSRVPILAATAKLQGRWVFTAGQNERGVAIVSIAFKRPGAADLLCRHAAVFIWDLLDGLVARGDVGAAFDASRAAVRAIELKYAARREAIARAQLSHSIGSPASDPLKTSDAQPGQAPVGVVPAGAGLPDLPPAGGPATGAAP